MRRQKTKKTNKKVRSKIPTGSVGVLRRPVRLTDIFLSISFFVFLLSFTIFAVSHFSGKSTSVVGKSVASKTAGNKPFFYKSLGTAPLDFGNDIAEDAKEFSNESYTLEIKIAYTRKEAEREVASLSARGIDAYYTPLQRGPQVVYRIRRGIFPDESLASKASTALRVEKGLATKIVRLQ